MIPKVKLQSKSKSVFHKFPGKVVHNADNDSYCNLCRIFVFVDSDFALMKS